MYMYIFDNGYYFYTQIYQLKFNAPLLVCGYHRGIHYLSDIFTSLSDCGD